MKTIFTVIFVLLSTLSVSASTTTDTVYLIKYNDLLIPFLSALAIYLFCTVLYIYTIFTNERINRKKSLLVATLLWVIILICLCTYFNNNDSILATLALCVITYLFIAFRSFKRSS